MSRGTIDRPALVAGLVVLALGALLLLDRTGGPALDLSALVPLFLAAAGALLLVTGLENRGRR